MKMKLVKGVIFILMIIGIILCFNSTQSYAVHQNTINIEVEVEEIPPNAQTPGNKREDNKFSPGESFRVLFYAQWGEDPESVDDLVKGFTIDVNMHQYSNELEANPKVYKRNILPKRNPKPSTIDSRLDYTDGEYEFFPNALGNVSSDTVSKGLDIKALGGQDPNADGLDAISMANRVLLGIVEYTIKEDVTSGQILFNNDNLVDAMPRLRPLATHIDGSGVTVDGPSSGLVINYSGAIVNISAPSSDARLDSLTVDGKDVTPNFNPDVKEYSAEVAGSSAALRATVKDGGTIESVTVGGETVPASGGVYNITMGEPNSSKLVEITTLSSKKDSTETYTVNITRAPDTNNKLTNLTFSASGSPTSQNTPVLYNVSNTAETSFSSNVNTYTLRIASDIKELTFTPTFGEFMTVTYNGETLVSNTSKSIPIASLGNTIEIRVTSQSGALNVYTITIDKRSTDCKIDYLFKYGDNAEEIHFTEEGNVYTASTILPFSQTSFVGRITAASGTTITVDGAPYTNDTDKTFSFDSGTYSKTIVYKVTSAFGNSQEYEFTVKRAEADTNTNIRDIAFEEVLDGSSSTDLEYTSSGNTYKITKTIPFTSKQVKAIIQLDSELAHIKYKGTDYYPNSGSINLFFDLGDSNQAKFTFTFDVYAEDGRHTTYTVEINRDVPSNNTGLDYELTNNSQVIQGSESNAGNDKRIDFNVGYGVLSVVLTLNLHDEKSTLYVGEQTDPNEVYTGPVTIQLDGLQTKTIYAKVKAETGDVKVYHFVITRRSDENSLINVDIEGHLDLIDFNEETTSYSITVAYSMTSVRFIVEKSEKSTLASGLTQDNVRYNLDEGDNIFRFQVISESGIEGKEYTILIKREQGQTGNDILSLRINGELQTGFNPSSIKYDAVLDRGTPSAKLDIEVSPGATYAFRPGDTIPLTAGAKNIVYIDVTSETGSLKTYTITIYAASQTVSLDDINILDRKGGTAVEDITNSFFEFDAATNNYTFNIPYFRSSVYLEVLYSDQYAKPYLSNGPDVSINPGASVTIEVYIRSEYGSLNSAVDGQASDVYYITIHREKASSDAYLNGLSFKIDGVEYINDFNRDKTAYVIAEEVSADSTVGVITATPGEGIIDGKSNLNSVAILEGPNTYSIIVTSEDGSKTVVYTIKVTREAGYDSSKDNTIIDIEAYDDEYVVDKYIVFNPTTLEYEINLPFNISSLLFEVNSLANVTIDGTNSKSKNINFTAGEPKVIEIYATSQSGSKGQTYTITVTREAGDSDTTLGSLTVDVNGENYQTFNNPQPDNELSEHYKVSVANDVNTADVTATLPFGSTAHFQNNPVGEETLTKTVQLKEGDNLVTFIVEAEDGSTATYVVNVYREPKLRLFGLTVKENSETGAELALSPTFDVNKTQYTVNVPSSVGSVFFSSYYEGDFDITGLGLVAVDFGTTTHIITLTSESGAVVEYEITLIRNEAVDALLESLSFSQTDGTSMELDPVFNSHTFTYTIVVPRSVETFDYVAIPIEGATITQGINNRYLNLGKNTYTIVVESESDNNIYSIVIYRADNEAEIIDIALSDDNTQASIEGYTFSQAMKVYNLTVPYTFSRLQMDFTYDPATMVIKVNGNPITNNNDYSLALKTGLNVIEVVGLSDYANVAGANAKNGVSVTYTFNITREEAASDAHLQSLVVSTGGKEFTLNPVFNPDTTVYQINELPTGVTSVSQITITGVPRDPNATVNGNGTFSVTNFVVSDQKYVFNIIVTAADGTTTMTYTVYLSQQAVDLPKDNSFEYITVVDYDGNEYLGQATFDHSQTEYTITLPYNASGYTIDIVMAAVTGKTKQGTGNFGRHEGSRTHTVYVVSASGDPSIKYNITIIYEEPSNEVYLEILADGVLLPDFDVNKKEYSLTRPYEVDLIEFTVRNASVGSTISGQVGVQELKEGLNTFFIIITAQDGVTQNTYTIYVTREPLKPSLEDLWVVNEPFLDITGNVIDYDPNIIDYYVVIPYERTQITIEYEDGGKGYNVSGVGTFSVEVGYRQRFDVKVIGVNGGTTIYHIYVTRQPEPSSDAGINNIEVEFNGNDFLPELTDDFAQNSQLGLYGPYVVENSKYYLDFTFDLAQSEADLKVYNAGLENVPGDNEKVYTSLEVGINNIVIVVTALDGMTKNVVVVQVERKPMEFKLDNTDITVTLGDKNVEDSVTDELNFKAIGEFSEYFFKLDLNGKNATEFNFKSLLESLDADDESFAEVEVVSVSEKEVILRLTDGDQTILVHFEFSPSFIDMLAPYGGLLTLILGILAIIILTAILISVNKQKLGRISNKRKRSGDKK